MFPRPPVTTQEFVMIDRRSLALKLIAVVGLACGASGVWADEDWRKLAHQMAPRDGAVWTAEGSTRADPPPFVGENYWLAAWFPLSAFPGGGSSGNDCWGYTSPSGRRYAIVGLQKGFGVVEVTNPRNAQYVGFIAGATSLWHDVKIIGQYAYGVSEGGLGIQVINLSNVDSGVVTLTRNHSSSGHSTTHNIVSNPATGYLYLCGANIGNGGLVAVSTSDPTRPSVVGAWTSHYVHDAQVVKYTSGPYNGREIAFCFNGSYGLEVIDVTNKGSMFKIGGSSYPHVSYCHQGWLSEDRRYLYIDDELDEGNKVATTTTRVFDVLDPANPVYIGIFTSGLAAIDHNQYTANGKIYQANYRSGLQVFDASNPTLPAKIGSFDTFPGNDDAKFNGAWSCYPYFGDACVLISDIEGGLFIVEYDDRKLVIDASGVPFNVPPDEPFPVTISIDEIGTTVVPGSVYVRASIDGGAEIGSQAVDNGDGTFTANLPAAPCHSDIRYYFTAESASGRTFFHPATGMEDALRVYSATSVVVRYQDTMEGTHVNGWGAGDPSDPDTATLGKWFKMPPQASVSQPGSGFTGASCWITDGRAGDDPTDYDVEGGKTTLMSPVIDMTGMADPRISYYRWFMNGLAQEASNEVFLVDISADGGATWTNMETVGPFGDGTKGGWHYAELKVPQFVPPTSTMRVRFVATDMPPITSVIEAAIDDFRVFDGACEFCPADYNQDGDDDVLDFLDFFDDFGQCENQPAPCGTIADADVNADTSVDVLDFLDYLDAFGIGCP
jgi:choice-of-anchor B domain-containing protein